MRCELLHKKPLTQGRTILYHSQRLPSHHRRVRRCSPLYLYRRHLLAGDIRRGNSISNRVLIRRSQRIQDLKWLAGRMIV